MAEAYAEVIGDEVLIEGVGSAKMVAKWGVRLAKIGVSLWQRRRNLLADKFQLLSSIVGKPAH